MGHQHLYSHLLFPVLAYVTVCLGSFQGWACTARFRARRTKAGNMWLALAATALGSALWGMHMITMLGFEVSGMELRHDALRTQLSALLCIGAAMLGLLVMEAQPTSLGRFIAGSVMAGGLTGAHLLGITALYAPAEFGSSVAMTLIAVIPAAAGAAATLWLTAVVDSRPPAVGASLVTGALLCCAQYTALAAVTVRPMQSEGHADAGLSGPTLAVAVAAFLMLTVLTVAFNLYITPVQDVRDTPPPLVTRPVSERWATNDLSGAGTVLTASPAATSEDRPAAVTTAAEPLVDAGPVLRIG